MTLIIRPYTDSDLQSVLSTWEEANSLAHPFLTSAFVDKVRHDIPKLYLPNADTWVAEENGSVMGFIALLGNEVGALFVQPERHGKGIGKKLMDKAAELHQELELEVFKANSIGRNFYSRYGFKLISEDIHLETGQEILRLRYAS
ncbi:GNAT family N-acetyltransferase [Endozoicomonas sp. OPT23]|nr:GNAT family N-acetyltransferase [Endozoicomonas sp. OPT23]